MLNAPAGGGGHGNFPREDSIDSTASSTIIVTTEKVRQRYNKLIPPCFRDGGSSERDYGTIVHTLTQEKLSALMKSKITDSGACNKSAAGLKEDQARIYLETFGKNEVTPERAKRMKLMKLMNKWFGLEMLICAFGDLTTFATLAFGIVSVALLRWYAETKAESTMQAMQEMQRSRVRAVRRNDAGQRVDVQLDPRELVPGDIIFIDAGQRIPADIRILDTDALKVDNSALTGESCPPPLTAEVHSVGTSPMDARNLAFWGTTIVAGSATAMVHKTGNHTFLGKIARGITPSRVRSALEIQTEHFGHLLNLAACCLGVLSLIANLVSPVKRPFADILQNFIVTLFVQTSQGLLPMVSILLINASQKMSKLNVLIRKLDAVETLGCVSVICCDFCIEGPPNQGVVDAIVDAQEAGVKVVMVTANHPDTAKSIANKINIMTSIEESPDAATFSVVTGDNLNGKLPLCDYDPFSVSDDPEVVQFWMKAVEHTRVFAQVSPIHKQVIIQAYQKFGRAGVGDIVATIGNDVDDACALKQAEVGVAMGISGTAVAQDAADIILLDDNFASMIAGVKQARVFSDNLQKAITYTLCSKVPLMAPTFAELFRIPQALTAAQILLIHIGTVIWTTGAYAMQSAEAHLMQRGPRNPRFDKIVDRKLLRYSYCYIGPLQMLCCWFIYFVFSSGIMDIWNSGKKHEDFLLLDDVHMRQGMTVYYWTLVCGQVAAAVCISTKAQSVVCGHGCPNMTLNVCFGAEFVMSMVVMYWTPMQSAFKMDWLPRNVLCTSLAAILLICAIEEARKLAVRSKDDCKITASANRGRHGLEEPLLNSSV